MPPVALVWPVFAPNLKKNMKKNYLVKEMVEGGLKIGIIKLFANTKQLFLSFFLSQRHFT